MSFDMKYFFIIILIISANIFISFSIQKFHNKREAIVISLKENEENKLLNKVWIPGKVGVGYGSPALIQRTDDDDNNNSHFVDVEKQKKILENEVTPLRNNNKEIYEVNNRNNEDQNSYNDVETTSRNDVKNNIKNTNKFYGEEKLDIYEESKQNKNNHKTTYYKNEYKSNNSSLISSTTNKGKEINRNNKKYSAPLRQPVVVSPVKQTKKPKIKKQKKLTTTSTMNPNTVIPIKSMTYDPEINEAIYLPRIDGKIIEKSFDEVPDDNIYTSTIKNSGYESEIVHNEIKGKTKLDSKISMQKTSSEYGKIDEKYIKDDSQREYFEDGIKIPTRNIPKKNNLMNRNMEKETEFETTRNTYTSESESNQYSRNSKYDSQREYFEDNKEIPSKNIPHKNSLVNRNMEKENKFESTGSTYTNENGNDNNSYTTVSKEDSQKEYIVEDKQIPSKNIPNRNSLVNRNMLNENKYEATGSTYTNENENNSYTTVSKEDSEKEYIVEDKQVPIKNIPNRNNFMNRNKSKENKFESNGNTYTNENENNPYTTKNKNPSKINKSNSNIINKNSKQISTTQIEITPSEINPNGEDSYDTSSENTNNSPQNTNSIYSQDTKETKVRTRTRTDDTIPLPKNNLFEEANYESTPESQKTYSRTKENVYEQTGGRQKITKPSKTQLPMVNPSGKRIEFNSYDKEESYNSETGGNIPKNKDKERGGYNEEEEKYETKVYNLVSEEDYKIVDGSHQDSKEKYDYYSDDEKNKIIDKEGSISYGEWDKYNQNGRPTIEDLYGKKEEEKMPGTTVKLPEIVTPYKAGTRLSTTPRPTFKPTITPIQRTTPRPTFKPTIAPIQRTTIRPTIKSKIEIIEDKPTKEPMIFDETFITQPTTFKYEKEIPSVKKHKQITITTIFKTNETNLPSKKEGETFTDGNIDQYFQFHKEDCYSTPTSLLCCNKNLDKLIENVMDDIFRSKKVHPCNFRVMTRMLNKRLENDFKIPFEIIMGPSNFGTKSHFRNDFFCKKFVNDVFVLAYGTPEDYPLEVEYLDSKIV